MKGHVVWGAVFVCVGDVMDCTDSHRYLADRVDNRQVDDCPEEEAKRQRNSGHVPKYQHKNTTFQVKKNTKLELTEL